MESIQGIQEARWEQTQHKGKHSVGRSKGTQDKCRSRTLRWAVPQASTICPNPKARHPGSSFSARDSARFHRCTSIHLLENARGIRSTRWNERTTKQTPAGKKLKMPLRQKPRNHDIINLSNWQLKVAFYDYHSCVVLSDLVSVPAAIVSNNRLS
jgi:hypothetical protein